jgi:hypothetical protein
MWKKNKEDIEEDSLKESCGKDAKVYDVSGDKPYVDPRAAMRSHRIYEKDLETLIEEADKSVKDKNYEEAKWKYGLEIDKPLSRLLKTCIHAEMKYTQPSYELD